MFKNRIRLPFYLSKPQFPVERNVFRKADGSSQLLSAIIRNTYEGKTDQLPEDWHRKLIIALAHDEVTIEDNRLLTDVVLDGDYEIDWQDFLNYPIASASFKIQTTPFNATNNNCQSCAEITQLNLVDDYTDEVWEEGTTNEYPDLITDNDSICCYPFTIEIMSFNTLYFDSVTVTQEGVLTVVVKDITPDLTNVLIATYRVTCPNGDYDEANVYGNISGSAVVCLPPTDLHVTLNPSDGTVASVGWIREPTPAGGNNWWLYACDDIYTVLQSGNEPSNNSVGWTDLTPGQCYVFAIQSDCGDGLSEIVTIEFTTPNPVDPGACGKYYVTNFTNEEPANYSYFDCDGIVRNRIIAINGIQTQCMLMDPDTNIPIFFAASSPLVEYEYIEPC